MLTTNKYIIKVSQITNLMMLIFVYDEYGKTIINEKMASKALYEVAMSLYYLLEENITIEYKFPPSNTVYGYILYGGISNKSIGGQYHLMLFKQYMNSDDSNKLVLDEYLEYYQLKNIISDIQKLYSDGGYYDTFN